MSRTQRWLTHLAFTSVAVSGIIYGAFKYFGPGIANMVPGLFPPPDDPFNAGRSALQPWALAAHVLAAPVVIFAFGWLLQEHALTKLAVRYPTARRSGIWILAVFGPVAASGYLVQTVTRPGPNQIIAWAHIGGGLLLGTGYLAHLVASKRKWSKR